jgi:hypothetical protein
VSQPGPPWPVTGIALTFLPENYVLKYEMKFTKFCKRRKDLTALAMKTV